MTTKATSPVLYSRRQTLVLSGAALIAGIARPALAAPPILAFDEIYGAYSPLGMTYSDKTKALTGEEIRIRGFMAPPLKAEAQFFVLTEIPMSICPFCSTDSDWPDNIIVVYLDRRQTFVQPNQMIEAKGRLERGSWSDPDTGFVSQLRLREARYSKV
ncbi:hypothetical protein [Martelella alba]|uniref:hypothetical protein n=1 Tax=Martelella alba TaxID=2590451 RepID=UPI0038B3C39C